MMVVIVFFSSLWPVRRSVCLTRLSVGRQSFVGPLCFYDNCFMMQLLSHADEMNFFIHNKSHIHSVNSPFRSAWEFATNRDQPEVSSFIRLEVTLL